MQNNDQLPDEETAFRLLTEMGCSEKIINHTKTVLKSLEILSKKTKKKFNLKLARIGAILHDIGRSKSHGINHGYLGAEILCKLNMPEELVKIVERHVGAGITIEEAINNDMPAKNFIPETYEEKIVCYADKLVNGDKINSDVSFEVEKWKKELGENHPAILRLLNLEKEMKNYE